MALTEEMKRQISEDAGVKDAFKKGDTKAAKILADLGLVGLSFLPVGAAIRGGQLVYKGLKGAKAAKELRKLKSVQDAIKAQRPAPGKPTTITAPKPTPKAKPKAKPNAAAAKKRAAAQRKLDALLATAVGAGALGAASKAVAPTKPKADPKKAAPKKRAKPGGTNKGADPKKAKPKARGPQTRGSAKPKSVRELEKLQKPRASGPSTRGGAKRGATKIVTAGKNVGFGPKGNIFPKNAADRARLMKLYGGTGSAAAKAAAAGKQGTLKKGKK